MLIAVDGSTVKTGFAFGGEADGVPRGGVWRLPGSDEHVFDRTLRMAGDSLTELARLVRAKHVVIEAPLVVVDREHSRATAAALIQLTGALRAGAARAGAQVTLISVDQVRKAFIGHARLPGPDAKRMVMDRCKQFNWPCLDDNHGDANAVFYWGMTHFYPQWQPKVAKVLAA